MIIKRKGACGDEVDALVLNDLVGQEALFLGDFEQLVDARLSAPVSLEGLLDLALRADAGKTKNS